MKKIQLKGEKNKKTVPESLSYEVEKPEFKSKSVLLITPPHTTKPTLTKGSSTFPEAAEGSQRRTRMNGKDSQHHDSLIFTSTRPALCNKHAASNMNGKRIPPVCS